MAFGTTSTPSRFGYGQSTSDDRNLFLKVFGAEVLNAFTEKVVTLDKHNVRTIEHGKRAQFPNTWKATSEMHSAGQEMLGNDIDTTEVTVTIDGLLVAHTAIYDLDEKMSHFDVTSEFSAELGRALARTFDKNGLRAIVLAARTSADGPFPAGNVITDAALVNSSIAATTGKSWIDHIREANVDLFNKNVPDDMPRYLVVNADVFDSIKYAVDSSHGYMVINRDFGIQAGGVAGTGEVIQIDGVQIMRSNLMPTTNETSDTSVYSKYRANYSTTTGIMWCPDAVGTLKLLDLNMEQSRDVRRQEDFMVAKMAVGTGTLRPECAVEFKTS